MTVSYTTKTGKTQYKPSLKWITDVIHKDGNKGFCLACGATRPNTEPDARQYECNKCHQPKVYGAEELMMMGLYHDGLAPKPSGTYPKQVDTGTIKTDTLGRSKFVSNTPKSDDDKLKLHPDFYGKD